jgi:hypothetical protein
MRTRKYMQCCADARRRARAGNHSEFARSVQWVSSSLSFDIDSVVSVFETNIRIMGAQSQACLHARGAHS